MVDLDAQRPELEAFVAKALSDFVAEHPSVDTVFVALFCYPVDGFLTVAVCSRTDPTVQSGFNVGDFDFPETAVFAPEQWYSEYWDKGDEATIRHGGVDYRPRDNDGGDAAFSHAYGVFLSKFARAYFASQSVPLKPRWIGVQVSYDYFDFWNPFELA